jgi:hypothetical protein
MDKKKVAMDLNFKHLSCRGPFSSFFPAAAAPVAMSIDVTLIVSDTVGGSPQFAMNIICTKDGFSMIFDDVRYGGFTECTLYIPSLYEIICQTLELFPAQTRTKNPATHARFS